MLVRLLNEKGLFPLLVMWAVTITLLSFKAIFETESLATTDMLTTHWALGWMHGHSSLRLTIGVALITIAVLMIRPLARRMELASKSGNIGALLFAVIVLNQPGILYCTDILIAINLILLLFWTLVSTYKEESALSRLFHVGMLVGISALFVGQSGIMLLAVYFGILILRTGSWREWVVPLLGLAMASVFLFLFLVWMEYPIREFQRIMGSAWISVSNHGGIDVGNVILLLAFVFSLPQLFAYLTTGTVSERNFSLVLLGWLVSAALMILFFGFEWKMVMALTAFPLATYVSRSVVSVNRWWLADLMLLLLLATPFLSIRLPF